MTTPVLNGRRVKTGTNQTIDSPVSSEQRDETSSTRISVLSGTNIVTIASAVVIFFERRRATI